MKKIVMIAFVAAATLSFAACNTKTEGAQGTEVDSTAVEAPVVEEVVTDTTALGKYETLVNEVIALTEKAKAGDATAVAEVTKLTQDLGNLSTELQKELANMTPEQAAKFAELGKKYAEATQAAVKK